MNSSRFRTHALLAAGLVGGMIAAAPLPAAGQEVVQQLPDPATETLNDALRRLSRNPESVPALVAAGRASLDLDDVDAALGFFTRAQNVAPEDGRVLVGLALVAVRQGEPVTALQLFDNADAAGEPMAPHAAERGLAYDLVGRNDRAQRLYRQALSRRETPEVVRRLALSYAIAGDAEAAETTLLPLLQRQDRAAFRTRAFALAIAGREEEAISIAETMLPQRLAVRLAPYLRYMPRLTKAQQAAAANLGQFPSTNEVGRDTPAIAALASSSGVAAPAPAQQRVSAAERLQPRGEPLGQPTRQVERPQASQQAPQPVTSNELPPVAQSAIPASSNQGTGAAVQSSSAQEAQPSFSLLDLPNSTPIASAPAEPQPDPEPQVIDLAEAFADFTLENAGPRRVAGAVDITAIEPRRESPEPPAPPPPPAHPARHWVQVATGQNTDAFRFDWRRIVRNAGGLLDGAKPHVARWGQTNRLLAGPYASAREAQELVSALAEAGVDSFRHSSEEGDEVQSLD